jgi:hypothetical protein
MTIAYDKHNKKVDNLNTVLGEQIDFLKKGPAAG